MFQMEQLISTKTQITTAERNIDSENTAEMAVDRYKREVSGKLGEGNTLENIKSLLKDISDKPIIEKLDENHLYTIKSQEYNSTNEVLKFKVTGEAYKKQTE